MKITVKLPSYKGHDTLKLNLTKSFTRANVEEALKKYPRWYERRDELIIERKMK